VEFDRRKRLEFLLIYIAPAPGLAGFQRLNDGVPRLVKVLGGVLAWRAVTAAYVAAGEAEPQVHPPPAGREALLAAGCPWRRSGLGWKMTTA
jgi:hypothetical protein